MICLFFRENHMDQGGRKILKNALQPVPVRRFSFPEHWSIGNGNSAKNSARSFSDRSFFELFWGHGCPRLRVMGVHTKMLVFTEFRGLDRSFCPRTSAAISAWTSAASPVPTLLFGLLFALDLRSRPPFTGVPRGPVGKCRTECF